MKIVTRKPHLEVTNKNQTFFYIIYQTNFFHIKILIQIIFLFSTWYYSSENPYWIWWRPFYSLQVDDKFWFRILQGKFNFYFTHSCNLERFQKDFVCFSYTNTNKPLTKTLTRWTTWVQQKRRCSVSSRRIWTVETWTTCGSCRTKTKLRLHPRATKMHCVWFTVRRKLRPWQSLRPDTSLRLLIVSWMHQT